VQSVALRSISAIIIIIIIIIIENKVTINHAGQIKVPDAPVLTGNCPEREKKTKKQR